MNHPQPTEEKVQATPLRCLTGSVISGAVAMGLYFLTSAIATSYATKPLAADSEIALRIGSAVRTLVVGGATLGTAIFAMATLGLIALGIQLALQKKVKA
jgi:Protein of unknown function (DUF3082)